MSLVAEFSVPADAFALEDTLDAVPGMRLEVERLATHSREWVMPFVWVTAGDLDEVEEALDADWSVENATVLDRLDEASLYVIEWHERVEERVDSMIDRDAIIQQAVAEEAWFIKVRFAEEEHLSAFRDHFGSNFELRRKARTTEPKHGEFGLSPEQREVLTLAAELGYFSVPREATVEDIADRLDISSNSVSQRLRRAHDALVRNTLVVDGRWSED